MVFLHCYVGKDECVDRYSYTCTLYAREGVVVPADNEKLPTKLPKAINYNRWHRGFCIF